MSIPLVVFKERPVRPTFGCGNSAPSSSAGGSGTTCTIRRLTRHQTTIVPRVAINPNAAPTPIPALAPVLSPGEGVSVGGGGLPVPVGLRS
jgi:hypothetical protein